MLFFSPDNADEILELMRPVSHINKKMLAEYNLSCQNYAVVPKADRKHALLLFDPST